MSAARVARLRLPERRAQIGASAGDANRFVQAGSLEGVLDTTHFDTVRFPPPEWAHEVLARVMRDGRLAYTPYRGHAEVLEDLAETVGPFLGASLDPRRELAITPGTQAGLFALLASLVEPGARVAVFDPDYLFTEAMLAFFGAQVEQIPLRNRPSGWRGPDLDALEAALAGGARLVVFSHPNNPTGAVYAPSVIARIAELAERYDAYVIVDELYARLIYNGAPFSHLICHPAARSRCATLVGPSKTESMSGFRLGVVVAQPGVIDDLEDVLSAIALRAPAYAQHLLRHWLRDDLSFVQQRVRELARLRETTTKRLQALDDVTLIPGEGTAYAFPDLSALGVADPVIARTLVLEARVLVSPGYQFGPAGVGSLRVCFARNEHEWDLALDRIGAALRTIVDSPSTLPALPST